MFNTLFPFKNLKMKFRELAVGFPRVILCRKTKVETLALDCSLDLSRRVLLLLDVILISICY